MKPQMDADARRLTRRRMIGVLGAGAAAFGATPQFPRGAIIRTILKDMAPEELAGGATLFHEHMSLAPDFLPRWIAYSRPAGAAAPKAPPAAPPAQPGQKYF